MSKIKTKYNSTNINKDFFNNYSLILEKFNNDIKQIKQLGGLSSIQKQHDKGKLVVRERIGHLIDENTLFFELSKFAAYGMYKEYGSCPAAGVITGICKIYGKDFMVIANDATVKAGAYFEVTLKKTLRAQEIAIKNNIPIIYLVDSAGVFLPLQEQVFPDEAHFGKVFYNNARISSLGINQIACVMGPCVAGGAYLPVMCDKYIITEGSNMFLAAPALVKAAIGQNIDAETLGGATTHSTISGTADYHEKDDLNAIKRIRSIVKHMNVNNSTLFKRYEYIETNNKISNLFNYIDFVNNSQYDMLEVIRYIVDNEEYVQYKENYGKTILCGNARIGGFNVGIVANQKKVVKANGKIQLGGVIYNDSADKAARFIMNCNQERVPIIFIHDVNGFMVGKEAEWSGIAKDGAKMVNAVSNSTVPKITLIIGGSYGAGNYAMSGKAYDPNFIYAWPNAKIAVMGGDQAANTLASIKLSKVGNISDSERQTIVDEIKSNYKKKSDIKYGAARLWVDEIIHPDDTKMTIIRTLEIINNIKNIEKANFGILQV
tara:strand:+ start:8062 stop:9699 length:1638 start_codon:yes stop_codon:yes gene_type:complete